MSAQTTKPASRAKHFFIVVAGVTLLIGASVAIYAFSYSQRILPRTRIAGVAVGGLREGEATERLRAYEEAFQGSTLTVTHGERQWQVPIRELGVTVTYDDALAAAYRRGKQGTLRQTLREHLVAPLFPTSYDVTVGTPSETGMAYLREHVLETVETPYREVDIQIKPGAVATVPGQAGEALDWDRFETELYRVYRTGTRNLSLTLRTKEPDLSPEQIEPLRQRVAALLANPWRWSVADLSGTVPSSDLAAWLKTVPVSGANGRTVDLSLSVNEPVVTKAVQEIAGTANRAAVNAQVAFSDGSLHIVTEGRPGVRVNEAATLVAIRETLTGTTPVAENQSNQLPIQTELVLPAVRAETIATLGIVELIGTATTDFSGSPNNRKFNISLGQRTLSGSLVLSGETFSTTATLGPVDEASGYLPELVIKNNRTVPEAGGGLCQVSTTLFRAVLNAGLPVLERTNHAYRVGYYERGVGPGLDATVYIPSPDFKWKNDTGKAILIQASVKDTKITFELYGTRDGRVSTISAPTILEETPAGAPIYTETDTLLKGERRQIETAHGGAKTLVTYTVQRDGKEIHRQNFRSTYRPWPAQYLVGTREPGV